MRTFTFFIVLLGVVNLSAQPADEEKTVNTEIESVTVFLDYAQVTRKGQITIPEGNTKLILKDLSPYIDEGTIKVKSEGEFLILSINKGIDYINPLNTRQEIETLSQQIKTIERRIAKTRAIINVYDSKILFFEENREIGGRVNGIELEDLREISAYYEQQIMELKLKKLTLKENMDSLEKEKNTLTSQISILNGREEEPSGKVIVQVSAKNTIRTNIEISYLVTQAGWFPVYDVRVKDIENPISVVYKAKVHQNTGEDWTDVNLTFSNAEPNKSGKAPSYNPGCWVLKGNYTAVL